MKNRKISRRVVLKAAAVLAGAALSTRVLASAPPPQPVTPELIAAAKKQGQLVVYCSSTDLPVAEPLAEAFEAKYPKIAVRVERCGADPVFQRIGPQYGSNIDAVGAVNSCAAAHFIAWKRDGSLQPCVPEDVARLPLKQRDGLGQFTCLRVWLSVIAHNTGEVKADAAPTGPADLLDPQWKGRLDKAHPGGGGTIVNATCQLPRDRGWNFVEGLAKQNLMQLQSSADPPTRLDLGERAMTAHGNAYTIFEVKQNGDPVEPVHAAAGSRLIVGPSGIFRSSSNPNAAKLFQSLCLSREAQRLIIIIDVGGLRSVHPDTKDQPGRTPPKDVKVMKDDPVAVERESEAIKSRYTKNFHV